MKDLHKFQKQFKKQTMKNKPWGENFIFCNSLKKNEKCYI